MTDRPVLRRGADGPAVAQLHRALGALGLPAPLTDRLGSFGAATEEAVRSFQRVQALQVDGICGRDTWAALEEQHPFGSRLIALRRPMMRGDDVRMLQARLDRLGFDPGRHDGIHGPHTDAALREFQRAAGVAPDGVCGPLTLQALERVGGLAAGSISRAREREQLHATPRQLAGRQIVLGTFAEFASTGDKLTAAFEGRGAGVRRGDDPQQISQVANEHDADLALVVQPFDDPSCRVAYYGTPAFRSLRGYAIARRVDDALAECYGPTHGPVARTFGILRETRMAAVVCQPSPGDVGRDLDCLVAAIVRGVQRGFEDPPADLD